MEIKRSGGNAVAKCVFHQDASPSMYVYPQHYHCYACKAHGSIIDYEMHRTGYHFRDVVENLAQQYHIHLEYETSTDEKKNALLHERFEKMQRDLENALVFFQEKLAKLKQNTEEYAFVSQELIALIGHQTFQHLSILYTGSEQEYNAYFNESTISELTAFNFANRFAFPLYKENGKLSGFFLSRELKEFELHSKQPLEAFCHFLSQGYQILTPFPKRTLKCLNWQQIRAQIAQQKTVYVVTEFSDFCNLHAHGVTNIVLSLESHLSANILKEFSAKVANIVLVVVNLLKNKAFFWNTFKEVINISHLNFEVLKLNISDKNFTFEDFLKLKSNTKKLWEEIIDNFMHVIPSINRLSEFNRKLLPLFYKIEEQSRRDLLLEQIAQKYFSSSKIIFSKRNTLDVDTNSVQKIIDTEVKDKNTKTFASNLIKSQNVEDSDIENCKKYLEKTIIFYHKILLTNFPVAVEARKYLEQRGFTLDLIEKWRLGLCPASHELAKKIEKKVVPLEPLLTLGLVKKSKMGDGYYDFFHDRIIIPIYGHAGESLGLSGRIFSQQHTARQTFLPKYINSLESKLFAKAHILFNFYAAMQSIVAYGYVIIVEGYMDCISLVNAGITNTVAVMGTSLTNFHIEALAKVTKRIVLCFDSDSAGLQATKRSFANVYHTKAIELEYLALPEGKDPDEFIKKFGAKEFLNLMANTVPLLNQLAAWLFIEAGQDSEVFLRLIKQQILPIVLQHSDLEVQNEALHFLCDKYFKNVYPDELRKELKGALAVGKRPHVTHEIVSHTETFAGIEWSVLTIIEVKLILSLVHAKFIELPERLQNVALEQGSGIEVNERICALAISNQMSKMSFSVYLEFLSAMVENQHISLLDIAESHDFQFSEQAKLVIAYVNSDVHILYQYKMEELLKENLPASVSMVSFKNIWDLKNSGFLRFQLRNIRLSAQRGVIAAFIAEALLQLELEYIDNALKAFSSFHFDNEIDEQFHDLVTERTRRSKEFGSSDTFSLQ